MSERTRKILIVVGFVVLVFGLAFLIYFLFFRAEEGVVFPTVTPGEEVTPTPGGFGTIPGKEEEFEVGKPTVPGETPTPTIPGGVVGEEEIPTEIPTVPPAENIAEGEETVIQPLTLAPVLAPSVSPAFNAVTYYNKDDGKFFKVGKNNTVQSLSDTVFPNADNISWASQGDKAVIEFPDGSNVIYNFQTKKQVTLPKEMQEFSFSKDGGRVAFKWITGNTNEHYIGTVSSDGRDIRFVEYIGKKQDKVKIEFSPSSKVVATVRESHDAYGSYIYFIGQNGENFSAAVTDGFGVEPKWSSTGKYLLYSSFTGVDSYKPRLWISTGDSEGEDFGLDRQDTGLLTWAEKCVFDKNDTYVYCAVPKTLPDGAGMLKSGSVDTTADVLYRVNLKTIKSELMALPINNTESADTINMKNLFLSDDEKTIFFTDGRTGTLNSIRLP